METDLKYFVRFISECNTHGLFENDEKLKQIAQAMDLDIDDVYEIINKANIWTNIQQHQPWQ
jgi:hypothetical protein